MVLSINTGALVERHRRLLRMVLCHGTLVQTLAEAPFLTTSSHDALYVSPTYAISPSNHCGVHSLNLPPFYTEVPRGPVLALGLGFRVSEP